MKRALAIALLVAALVAGGLVTRPDAAAQVAVEIARQLHGRADGSSVIVPEGRLIVTDRSEDSHKPAHFHIKLGTLDACAVGLGDTPEERTRATAEHFVSTAWPVFVSHAHRFPELSAVRFHGGEVWGIPGRAGFMAGAFIRGAKGADVPTGSALFAAIPGLPNDDTAHLVKAVLHSEGSQWKRSIELDGETKLESDAALSGAPSADGVIVTQFAVIEGLDHEADAASRAAAVAALLARPSWLPATTECPAVSELVNPPFSDHACSGGRFADCIHECEGGEGPSCYAAAIEIEREHAAVGHALHLAACRRGHASACTNAAASRLTSQADDACSRAIFEAVCEKADDPWACVMFGRTLKNDPPRAKAVLAKACHLGEGDPACAAAKNVLAGLDGQ
jgi:hypothetical protein